MNDETAYDEEKRFHPGLWIGWILAAVFLAIALWLAHHMAWVRREVDIARGNAAQLQLRLNHADQLVDALTSPESKHVVLTENRQPAHPGGEVSWLASKGALVFVAGGLKPLSAGKTYELWLEPAEGQAPIPAGLFQPDADASATVVLPPLPAQTQAKRFLVTIEPSGGSTTPSLPIVMQGP